MIGPILRHWRQLRGMSQMGLASEAAVSPRHLSFLETGRARPSADMTLRLAEALAMPLRARNELLVAAGFAPRFGTGGWDSPELSEFRAAARLILDTHAPNPAIVFNGHFDVLDANQGAWNLLGDETQAMPNLVDLVFQPGPVRAAIVNWEEVASYFLHRLRQGVRLKGPESHIAQKLRQAMSTPGAKALTLTAGERNSGILLSLQFRTPEGETRWFTTVTSFGGPQDALAEEITIEMFHPMP